MTFVCNKTMRFIFAFLFLTMSFVTYTQTLSEIHTESIKAYKNKDFEAFKSLNLKALELHPSQPTILYNLAVAYNLVNDQEKSFKSLKKLLSWNTELPFSKDNDFKSLLANEIYMKKLMSLTRQFNNKKEGSSIKIKIPKNFHVEDIELINKSIYFTDVSSGKILKINTDNKVKEIARLKGSAMAIIKDENKKYIWASSANLKNCFNCKKGEKTATITKIDITNGKILKSIELPKTSIIGSMVLHKKKIYATNSSKPQLFIIDTSTNEIEKIIDINEGFNLQGVTLDKKRNTLYIADYIKGIVKIELSNTSNRTWLKQGNYLLKGIDGLTYINKNTLIAIQNNSKPKKVIKIKHNHNQVNDVVLLDNSLPYLGEPTNGKYYKKVGFLYVSNSQWPFYSKDHKPLLKQWKKQDIRQLKKF